MDAQNNSNNLVQMALMDTVYASNILMHISTYPILHPAVNNGNIFENCHLLDENCKEHDAYLFPALNGIHTG